MLLISGCDSGDTVKLRQLSIVDRHGTDRIRLTVDEEDVVEIGFLREDGTQPNVFELHRRQRQHHPGRYLRPGRTCPLAETLKKGKIMLCLHVDSKEVRREELVGLPTPQATQTWQPISHDAFESMVREELDQSGIEVVHTSLGLSEPDNEGFRHRMFGVFETEDRILDGVGMAVGFRNSTDRSLSAGLVFGSRVFVCDNLAFSGEVVLKRKHTSRILDDLPGILKQAVDRYADQVADQRRVFEQFQNTGIDDQDAYHTMVQAAHQNVIPYSRIRKVREEWHEPKHEEFKDRTAWSLYNAFTETVKTYDGLSVSTRTLHLTQMFRGRYASG